MSSFLDGLISTELEPHQRRAVESWAEDVLSGVQGPEPTIQESALLRHLNNRHFHVVYAEFSKWVLIDGRLNSAACARRFDDQRLFRGGN